MGWSFYGMRRAACAALAALACAAGAAPLVKTQHVEAELVADSASAQPGKPLTMGLKLRMEPGWHTYWKNPGDSGLPTRIQWQLPPGWKAGAIEWPYPQKLPVGPLMNYGYEDEVVLLVPVTPPADAPLGRADVKAHVEWLVCKDICIPEKGELDFTLPVSKAPPAPEPRWQAHIGRARNMLPVAATGWKADAAMGDGKLVVRLDAPAGIAPPSAIAFFPERENLVDPAAPQKITREGNALRIEMKLADPPLGDVTNVSGVAVADAGWPGLEGRKALDVEAPVGSRVALAGQVAPTSDAVGGAIRGGMWAALAFAFIGGILLNLMPCVFPVLGIKVMGFVQHAHGEARAMRMQGLAYAVGVMASFLVLAGVMLALRAGGTQLGWGFQLQSPAFVSLLAALFFVLALNLSGVFEWGAFAQSLTANITARGRYADAFLSGVLATVVATPCTAPFMGAAVGFTLSQDAAIALWVFMMVGAGMALPVLALSFFPAAMRRLPRPGAWMETFKQVLAFPLYATVAWLAWVLGAQASNDAVFALLAGLVLVAMAAWFYGRWAHAGSRWQPALAILLAAVGVAVAWPSSAPRDGVHGEIAWQAWSPEKVGELTARGTPVFVDFTAAWCVTCQVNKRVALGSADVAKAFADRGIVTLRADWTRQDPRITRTLAGLGRNAVPVYALYVPGQAAPHLLPEVLTPSIVLGEVSQLPVLGGTALTQR
ncbi:MAG TPA: protein-disulfide reductase DsbD domain-containing protein [Usitatibacter sp.]|jgi:thiol:disulfide interchange protein DsbD|nr:protein-disulfide reductase DsbD domain-containing protein [Usitatibacter sp.]